MRTVLIPLAAAALTALSVPSFAFGGGELSDTESARANARAGGPVSARDAELLERYGCLSGTDSPACDRGHRGHGYDNDRSGRHYYRHHHNHRHHRD